LEARSEKIAQNTTQIKKRDNDSNAKELKSKSRWAMKAEKVASE
jgi:hypothetical protein